MHYIIEGVDRLGKSRLVENIQKQDGPYMVQHFSKPLISRKIKNNLLELHENSLFDDEIKQERYLEAWQIESFKQGFTQLANSLVPLIFDRFHLGEVVYSPLYRGYSGDYVFNLEDIISLEKDQVRMILLITSDFSFITNDGESFDFSAKEKEQQMFIDAFHRSSITNKLIIDINDGGKFRNSDETCRYAMNKHVTTAKLLEKMPNG